MRRYVLLLGLAVGLAPPALAAFTPSGLLEIHIIDIGQANAALVIGPNGKKVMLEAGAVADGKVYDYLIGLGMVPGPDGDKLDYTLAGHLHADHYRGFRRIFPPDPASPDWVGFYVANNPGNWFNGSPKIDDDILNPNGEIAKYKAAAVRSGGGTPQAVDLGWTLILGEDAWMKVVAVNGQVIDGQYVEPETGEENDASIAILIHYRDFEFIWASDLTGGNDDRGGTACTTRSNTENDVETPLAEALTPEPPGGDPETMTPLLNELGVDVLQVNHHGSETSTNSFYIGRMKPEVAVISVGSHGTYKHPREVVVDQVLRAPASDCKPAPPALVLQTSESYDGAPASKSGYCVGDIWIMTDGTFYAVGAGGGPVDERAAAGLPLYLVVDDQAPGCPMEVTVSDVRIDTPWEWRAKHRISTEGTVRLADGAEVLLEAGNRVELSGELVVDEGALLTFAIEPFTDCAPPPT